MKTFSTEQELRAVVGICGGESEIQGHLLASLTPEHFADQQVRELYERVSGLVKNHRNIPSVHTLQHDPAVSEFARDMLLKPLPAAETVEDADAILDQLEMFRKLRVLYFGTRDTLAHLKEPTPTAVDAALASLEKVTLSARSHRAETKIIRSGAGSNAESIVQDLLIQRAPDRIKTGFPAFDKASGGFARKDLVLMAATTGGGKSVMAEQLAINAYLFDNRKVAIVSFEMDSEELYARLLSNLTEISFDKVYLRRLSHAQTAKCLASWKQFNQHGEQHNCAFDIWCPSFEVSPDLLAKTLKPRGYDLILIDYVGLVQGDQKTALWENLGNITRAFKLMANDQNCAVVVFAQLDEDTNKVKYSKAMKHHSSYVWTWSYGEEEEQRNEMTIEQSKARHCKPFPFDVIPNLSIMQMLPLEGGVTPRQFLEGKAGPPVSSWTPPGAPPEPVLTHRLANVEVPVSEDDL